MCNISFLTGRYALSRCGMWRCEVWQISTNPPSTARFLNIYLKPAISSGHLTNVSGPNWSVMRSVLIGEANRRSKLCTEKTNHAAYTQRTRSVHAALRAVSLRAFDIIKKSTVKHLNFKSHNMALSSVLQDEMPFSLEKNPPTF